MSISVETLALAKKNTKQAVEEAVTSVYRYKGSVETFEDLPTSGQKVGDVYNVEKEAGRNYAWDGNDWDALGIAENLGDIEFEGEGIVEKEVSFDGNNDRVAYDEYMDCSKAIPLENLASNEIIIEHEGHNNPYYLGYGFSNSANNISYYSGPGIPVQNTNNRSVYILENYESYKETYKYFFLPLTHEKRGPGGVPTGEKQENFINPIITYKTVEQGIITKTINQNFDDSDKVDEKVQIAKDAAQAANNQANAAYGQASSAYNRASSAYNQANTASNDALSAYNAANAANSQATSAYNATNALSNTTNETFANLGNVEFNDKKIISYYPDARNIMFDVNDFNNDDIIELHIDIQEASNYLSNHPECNGKLYMALFASNNTTNFENYAGQSTAVADAYFRIDLTTGVRTIPISWIKNAIKQRYFIIGSRSEYIKTSSPFKMAFTEHYLTDNSYLIYPSYSKRSIYDSYYNKIETEELVNNSKVDIGNSDFISTLTNIKDYNIETLEDNKNFIEVSSNMNNVSSFLWVNTSIPVIYDNIQKQQSTEEEEWVIGTLTIDNFNEINTFIEESDYYNGFTMSIGYTYNQQHIGITDRFAFVQLYPNTDEQNFEIRFSKTLDEYVTNYDVYFISFSDMMSTRKSNKTYWKYLQNPVYHFQYAEPVKHTINQDYYDKDATNSLANDTLNAAKAYTDSKFDISLKKEVVQELPAQGEEDILYLVPKTDAETDDIYDEYIWTNNDWEKIGSTATDLSNYYNKAQINSMRQADHLAIEYAANTADNAYDAANAAHNSANNALNDIANMTNDVSNASNLAQAAYDAANSLAPAAWQEISNVTTNEATNSVTLPIDKEYDEYLITFNRPVAMDGSNPADSMTSTSGALTLSIGGANVIGGKGSLYEKMNGTYTVENIVGNMYHATCYRNNLQGADTSYTENVVDINDVTNGGAVLATTVGSSANIASNVTITLYGKGVPTPEPDPWADYVKVNALDMVQTYNDGQYIGPFAFADFNPEEYSYVFIQYQCPSIFDNKEIEEGEGVLNWNTVEPTLTESSIWSGDEQYVEKVSNNLVKTIANYQIRQDTLYNFIEISNLFSDLSKVTIMYKPISE